MRGKVISRFAAGTFGICMIYSVVSQALSTESSEQEALNAWVAVPASVIEPEEIEAVPKKTQEEQWFFPQEGSNQDNSRDDSESDSADHQFFRGGKRGGKGGGRHGRWGERYNGPLVKTTHEKNIVNRVYCLGPEEVA